MTAVRKFDEKAVPGGFVVVRAIGSKLAHTYVKSHASADGLTDAEALAIARAIAKLALTS